MFGAIRPYRWWKHRACILENAVFGKSGWSVEARVRAALIDEVWQKAEFLRRAAGEVEAEKERALRSEMIAVAKERRALERSVRLEERHALEVQCAEWARHRVSGFAADLRVFEFQFGFGKCPGQRGEARFVDEQVQECARSRQLRVASSYGTCGGTMQWRVELKRRRSVFQRTVRESVCACDASCVARVVSAPRIITKPCS